MIALLCEVVLAEGREGGYLAIAEALRGDLARTGASTKRAKTTKISARRQAPGSR